MKPLHHTTTALKELIKAPRITAEYRSGEYPKLTVITPSYNQGDFLERTILSVLNQNYPNLEYMIIDGGSSDQSVEVIKKYEKHLAYWISEKDKGQVHALNKGLSRATGDWISFQNSDDVYFPGTFEKFGKAASRSPEADMLYGDLFMITPQDKVTELLKTLPFSMSSQLIEGMQIHNQSLFFRRSLIEKYGDFDESYRFAFDYEFITRYLSNKNVSARRIEGLAGALRVHPDAKSSVIAEVGRTEHQQIQEKYNFRIRQNVPLKMQYIWCRLRKVLYLLSDLDVNYIAHRLTR